MTAPTLSLTESQTLQALGQVLTQLLPDGLEIVTAQDNRVPEPAGPDFVMMSLPIVSERLSTNVVTYNDETTQPEPGLRMDLMPSKVTVQVDVHGPAASNNARVIQTLIRSSYGVDLFKATGFDVTPLYTSEPRQLPFTNESQQVEKRVSIDIFLQCNPVVTTGQDFALSLDVGLVNVDVTYPPAARALRIQNGQIVHTATGAVAKLRGYNWGIWGTVQPQDARDAAAQGATMVRIPLRWWGLYNNPSFESRDTNQPLTACLDYGHLRYLDSMMAEAAAAGLYINLFCDSQCGQSGLQPGGFGGDESLYCDPDQVYPNGHNFWTDLQMREQYLDLWKFLLKRYASNPYFVFAEIMVEPNPPTFSDKDINLFYKTAFTELRPHCPGILFITGGQSYQSNQIGNSYIPGSTDVVYTADMFMQFGHDHAGNIADYANRIANLQTFIATTGAPVLVQQCGVTFGNDQSPLLDYTNAMLSQLNAAGLPWEWWTYRDLNPNGFGPYYQVGDGWAVNQPFLDTISSYLAAA